MEKITYKDLPKDIRKGDLKYPSYKKTSKVYDSFELWYVRDFEWCIPTLFIRNASRRSPQNFGHRTYAVRLNQSGVVRIGLGPHVLARVTVYVRDWNVARLQKYLDMQKSGESDANVVRDRISSRRAQGSLRRPFYF